jgi:hypothetical protein
MLNSFHDFTDNRQIVYSTGNTACDYKRLTGAYSFSDIPNPFPPKIQWFNVGQELAQYVIGPENIPIVSPYWKLGVIHPALYQVKEDNIIISSVEPPDNYITAEQGIPDTVKDTI